MSSLISSETLPTLTSTIISSSSCSSSAIELVPASFAYSNNTGVGKVPVASSSGKSTIYEYETVTTDDIYEVIQTVCDTYSNCYATTELQSFTTYTATVDGVLTVITTGVPYTGDAAIEGTTTETDITTTLHKTITATITSCGDKECYTTTETQVLTTETSTVDGVETIYTTYCPLSSAEDDATTVTDISSTVITITSCSDDKCHKVPVTTGVTTVTEDNTVYTTYCPLSSETTAPVEESTTSVEETTTSTEILTTVITITSCADDKCHEVPVTTGVTTVTEDNTIYTTYCPLSTTEEEDTTSTVQKTITQTTSSSSKIVDVITDNIVTETPTHTPTTVVQSVATSVSVPLDSVYEGSANTINTGLIAILLSFALTFF